MHRPAHGIEQLHDAQIDVVTALNVVAEAPLYTYEDFEQAVYFGDTSVVDALAHLIEHNHPATPDETTGLMAYQTAGFRCRVFNKILYARSESWGSDPLTPHRRVTLRATKRYIPFISWHPQHWAVELRDGGDQPGSAHILDMAETVAGKHGKRSCPANTAYNERFHDTNLVPPYLRPKHGDSANVLRVSEFYAEIEHLRDNIVDLGVMLLAATGARVIIKKNPPNPELGKLRIVKSAD